MDGFPLKIIPKGEIPKHFKISAVPGGLANVIDIACADAFLAGGHTMARRLLLPGEIRLHRGHAGIDEQQGCIVLRDQRKAGQAKVVLALKIREIGFSQFIESSVLHIWFIPPN
jgi:hypothetical protein